MHYFIRHWKKEVDSEISIRRGNKFIVDFTLFVLVCFLLYFFLTMYYSDILITCEHSINFLHCLFRGKFLDFYDYAKANSTYGTGAMYDVLVYMLFGIWNFPVFILNRTVGVSIFNPVFLLWYKLLVVIFVGVCIYYIRKICWICTKDEKKTKYIVLFSLSSLLVIVPSLQVAQYDAIYLCLMLMGVYNLMQRKKKLFVLFFALAVPIKFISLIFFIPLLLLSEKNIIKIIVNICCIGILPLISKVLFGNSIAYAEIENFTVEYFFDCFYTTNIRIVGIEGISFFAISYACICIYAHAKKMDVIKNKEYIQILFGTALFFFYFCNVPPYWLIILGVFLNIYIFVCIENLDIGLWLELVISSCFFICHIIKTNWVFGGQRTFSYLFLKAYCRADEYNVGVFLNEKGFSALMPIITGVLIGSGIMLLIIRREKNEEKVDGEYNEKILIWHFVIRVLLIAVWSILEIKVLL